MNIEEYIEYCLSKPGVHIDFPFDGNSAWIKVKGKLFAITNTGEMKIRKEIVPPFHQINLKCDPYRAVDLRESHDWIIPAWHMNKKHWNSVLINLNTDFQLVLELTDHSYDLVVNSLSKKDQKDLLNIS